MEKIQDWTIEDKQHLKDFIINKLDIPYDEICVGGSRISEYFRPNSDIDGLVFVKGYGENTYNSYIFTGVSNSENPYKDFRITIKNYTKFEENIWESAGHIYNLPLYSLMTDTYYEGNPNHLKHHLALRKLIADTNGINVPFDDFNIEYGYLL